MGILDVPSEFHQSLFGAVGSLPEAMDAPLVQLCALCGQYLHHDRPLHSDVGMALESLGPGLLRRFLGIKRRC